MLLKVYWWSGYYW